MNELLSEYNHSIKDWLPNTAANQRNPKTKKQEIDVNKIQLDNEEYRSKMAHLYQKC